MAKSFCRGHEIYYKKGKWLYSDTNETILDNERKCPHCGKSSNKNGHDNCLGTLPNVINACCGHGKKEEAYIQLIK